VAGLGAPENVVYFGYRLYHGCAPLPGRFCLMLVNKLKAWSRRHDTKREHKPPVSSQSEVGAYNVGNYVPMVMATLRRLS